MKRPFHPLLLSFYPVLFVSATYSKDYLISEVMGAILVTLLFCALSFFLMKLLAADPQKAAFLTSFTVLWFFSYGFVHNFVSANLSSIGTLKLTMPLWIAVLGGFVLYVRSRISPPYENVTYFMNVFSIVLCLLTFTKSTLAAGVPDRGPNVVMGKNATVPSAGGNGEKRDIYLIVADSYAGNSELRNLLGFDNSAFVDSLAKRGFYVPAHSHSNYAFTHLSIRSLLEMKYIHGNDFLADSDNSLNPRQTTVVRYLEEQGYTLYDLSIWNRMYEPITNSFVTSFFVNELTIRLITMATLPRRVVSDVFESALKRHDIPSRVKKTIEVARKTGPKFVYVHFMIPHHPYVFDTEGDAPAFLDKVMGRTSDRTLYVNQIEYANKILLSCVDTILESSKGKAIVILQGDHGATFGITSDPVKNRKLRMSILNAYRFPDVLQSPLNDHITPVNSFRVMLNKYFGLNLDMLHDESFFSAPYSPKLVAVTEALHK